MCVRESARRARASREVLVSSRASWSGVPRGAPTTVQANEHLYTRVTVRKQQSTQDWTGLERRSPYFRPRRHPPWLPASAPWSRSPSARSGGSPGRGRSRRRSCTAAHAARARTAPRVRVWVPGRLRTCSGLGSGMGWCWGCGCRTRRLRTWPRSRRWRRGATCRRRRRRRTARPASSSRRCRRWRTRPL